MIHSKLSQWNIAHKRIFLRADLNIPLVDGKIHNDFRLKSILPTLDFLISKNAHIILATHIDRPHHKDPQLSTKHLLPWFIQRGYSIEFVEDFSRITHHTTDAKKIFLLENLRFFPGEKDGDPVFAKQLAATAHYYVNDAFGLIHENDCSTTLLPYEFDENRRTIGFLMEKELQALDLLKNNPPHPFIAILGGGKVEDKIPLITSLLNTVDGIMLCPAICFTFLKALGQPVGKSLVAENLLENCKSIIRTAENNNVNYYFPDDYQVALDSLDGPLSYVDAHQFPEDGFGIAVGPKTVEQFSAYINQAQTIFFNCAMGFEERPETQKSSKEIINAMAHSSAYTIIAGGDSVAIALQTNNYAQIDHLSTGGGAALAYLSNRLLPGLAAFEED